jgi:hypothetical protein
MCGEPDWVDAGYVLQMESHPWNLDLRWSFNVTDDMVYRDGTARAAGTVDFNKQGEFEFQQGVWPGPSSMTEVLTDVLHRGRRFEPVNYLHSVDGPFGRDEREADREVISYTQPCAFREK